MTGSSNSNNGITEFIAGFLGGACGKLIDHPFDLVKVRLQVQSSSNIKQYAGTMDCVRQTLAKEGVPGLYKGLVCQIILN